VTERCDADSTWKWLRAKSEKAIVKDCDRGLRRRSRRSVIESEESSGRLQWTAVGGGGVKE